VLPPGWVRGDPEHVDADHPQLQVAFHPGRHTVACLPIEASSDATAWLAAAGFEPMKLRAEALLADLQVSVRNRRSQQTPPP
jgi:hypothetical protein